MINKINKTKARKLFEQGKTIGLIPCKVSIECVYICMIYVRKDIDKNFDDVVNRFEYYNCNNQVGRYASYYINE